MHIMLHIIGAGVPQTAGQELPQSFQTWPPQSAPMAQGAAAAASRAAQSALPNACVCRSRTGQGTLPREEPSSVSRLSGRHAERCCGCADREELQQIVHVDCAVTGDVLCARRRGAEGRQQLQKIINIDLPVAVRVLWAAASLLSDSTARGLHGAFARPHTAGGERHRMILATGSCGGQIEV